MTLGSPSVLAALLFAGTALVLLRLQWTTRRGLEGDLDRLELQNDIGRVLLTDRNMRGVTRHVAESAARLAGSDLAHVTLVTEHEQRLVVEAATGALAHTVGAAVPREGSMAGWVIKHVQPLVVNDPNAGKPWRSLHERIPLRRSVMLPLIARGRCIGALGVDNPRDGRAFGPADVSVLRDLADYAALTIEAIQAIEELRERERHAALLNRINSRIRQSLDLQIILDTAARELGAALGASRVYIRLRRGGELLPTVAEWSAGGIEPLVGHPDPAAAFVARAWQEQKTVESPDVREIPTIGASLLPGPLAVLATPIVLRGDVVGLIAFHHVGMPRLWRAGDIGLVEEVAGELAVAISNARLYRTVEDASRELSVKISELERANRMKAQFLANMSHELRTPLNSVIGFSELLLAGAEGRMSSDQHDALETISRNGRHLLDLVNDVLDLAKVDAGRMDLHLVPVDVRQLVSGVIEEMETLLKAKDQHLSVELPDGPLEVAADATRARQVLVNLLSNAIKFTAPGGEITVKAERRRALLPAPGLLARPQERDVVWLAVSDNGIGIAPDDQPRLFTEFSQVDQSYARRYEGTGLGLALCKRLMDLHGGRIGVDSAQGRGSTFWVEFPVEGPVSAAA